MGPDLRPGNSLGDPVSGSMGGRCSTERSRPEEKYAVGTFGDTQTSSVGVVGRAAHHWPSPTHSLSHRWVSPADSSLQEEASKMSALSSPDLSHYPSRREWGDQLPSRP